MSIQSLVEEFEPLQIVEPTTLLDFPNELLLYIFKHFLDLDDLWKLLQVSRTFRLFSMHTIHRRWKIEISPESTMKTQCRAALVALETLSCQLSTQTRVTPFAYQTSYLSASTTAAPSFVSASSGMPDPAFVAAESTTTTTSAAVGLLDQRRPVSTRSLSPYYDDLEEDDDLEDDDVHPQQRLLLLADNNLASNSNSNSSSSGSNNLEEDGNEEEEEGEEGEEEDMAQVQIVQQQQQIDYQQRDNTNKLFHHLMRREERLHQRIVYGISSYKHQYVLIEDIDIRNRIRSAVDVIFHHAVFVTAVSRSPVRLACTHASSNNRALAAMMVRLLTRLDVAFPACCREITFTLADNIKAFLEYTGYKLMSLSKANESMTQQQGEVLYSLVFGPACQSSAICNSSSSSSSSIASSPLASPLSSPSSSTGTNHHQHSNTTTNNNNNNTTTTITNTTTTSIHTYNNTKTATNSHQQQTITSTPISSKLLDTLHSISACFDLMGAAFIGKILSENHVECAVQRACELLSDSYLRPVKRALLVDLLEGWLTIKRGLVASELCRWVRTEIERCDQQQQQQQQSSSLITTTMRTTSSLHPPLSDLVSLAHLQPMT